MKNRIAARVISLAICLIMLLGVGVIQRLAVTADAAPLDGAGPTVGNTKCILTSSGSVMIQAYIGTQKGVSTAVSFYSATKLPVYAFESTTGGGVPQGKKSERETSMGNATDDGYYLTWTSDGDALPYQAFEVDVAGVDKDIVFGFEGHTKDANATLIMQVYDPATDAYFETSRDTQHNSTITLTYTVDAQKYAQNGRVRYRITFPEGASDKWIYLHTASAAYIDKDIQYGATKTKTSSGNCSLNYKASSFAEDEAFCAEAVNEYGVARSLPIYFIDHNVDTHPDCLWHFNVNFNGNAGTCRNMFWTTVEDMPSVVQVIPYGPIEQDFSAAAVYTGTVEFYDDFKGSLTGPEEWKKYYHYVTVDGLEAGREYWYRYGNGDDVWSPPCYLRTDDGDSKFAFFIGGDPQPEASGATQWEDIVVAYGERYREMTYSWNEAVRLTGAEFFVCTGDETDAAMSERCWNWYYQSGSDIFRSQTLASTMGNHDFRYDSWNSSFNYPYWVRKHNYVDPLGEYDHGFFYSFDYGNVHFTVINGNIAAANDGLDEYQPDYLKVNFRSLRDKQLAWLEQDLASTDKDFKIVVSHQGMYSFPVHTYDSETKELRSLIVPILDRYGVDIFFQGHDHVWIRTNTMKGGSRVAENSGSVIDVKNGVRTVYTIDPVGTTYTNCGSLTGSKYHDPDPSRFTGLISFALTCQPELPTFSTVEIENGRLQLKGWAREADGTVKRISEYTCYPLGSAQSDGMNIVRTSFYTKLNARIDALPDEITLDNGEEIADLLEICGRESDTMKTRFITSYEKLAAAKEQYDALVAALGTKGDLDRDGEITVSDALAALRIAAKLAEETPDALRLGDADGDGSVTVSDALAILRVAVGLAEAL
ncbi:MAG: metallophosphoesterase [Clostridia bacterium]|nr:metallophosphoesterase [Clostridia bacterium]